eukprot:g10136.t1
MTCWNAGRVRCVSTLVERTLCRLQLACEKGHAAVVEVLMEADPDKGARLKETLEKWSGFTALHLIAYRGHEDAAKVMLRPDKILMHSWDIFKGELLQCLATQGFAKAPYPMDPGARTQLQRKRPR